MKNHIVFKFIAILLCAASLMGAVGSGLGIFVMTESDLYQKTAEEAYGEVLMNYAEGFANDTAVQYAAKELGGAGDALVDSYYGSGWYSSVFDMNRLGYVISDAEGNVLVDQSLSGSYEDEQFFQFTVTGNYLKVLSEMTQEEYRGTVEIPMGVTTQIGDDYVYNAIPGNGAEVFFVEVQYADGSGWGVGSPDEPLGFLAQYEDGTVEFLPTEDYGSLESGDVNSIHFLTWDGTCIYEASSPNGVLEEYRWTEGAGFTLRVRNLTEEVMTMDAIPMGGCAVTRISVTYADGFAESVGGAPDIGYLDYDEEGRVRFVPYDTGPFPYKDVPVTHIAFYDGTNGLVYESRDPEGVGYFLYQGGELLFLADRNVGTDTPVEETVPDATEVPAELQETRQGIVNVHSNVYAGADLNASVVAFVTVGKIVEIIPQEDGVWGWIPGTGWVLLEGITLIAEDASPYAPAVAEETAAATETPAEEESVPDGTIAFTIEQDTAASETMEVEISEDTSGMVMEVPAETIAEESVPAVTEVPMVAEYAAGGTEEYGYYDYVSQQHKHVEYTHEPMPAYTVEVQLAKGAFRYEHEWVLIRTVYAFRNQLAYILAGCLLLFAILAVYLCCAAGRKPGTKEIHAGGLNCIPLDLYACIAAGGVAVLAIAGVEGTEYLFRSDTTVGVLFALLCAYGASLLIVAFCFACAAQFKTPHWYWWRNSLCGFLLKLAGKVCRWLLKFAAWAAKKCETGLWPWLVSLFRGAFKVVKVLLKRCGQWLQLLVKWLQRCGDWMGKKLNRFFSMLPLTWQWLLTGFILVFLLYVALRSYKVGWILLGFGLFFAVILYAASAFGILLENAKRMSKGDLDSKVEDQMLVGGFKDFAVELNGLADVAVVAAQKQLKSERMKTELITNVSHDIKTPLTSIINYVDLLQKPHTDAEQEQYLEVLDRQSQRLKKLIDDLMEMSKASTGNLSVDVTRVDAAEAVNQALGEFADKLDKAQLIPVFRQPEETVTMLADGRLVWRVMSNLLSNAVKYALPGTRVYVDLQKLDSKVIISMKNISREELNVEADELLERFVRGDASRNTEGSGLGLNIAQSLMELQKGQLQILVDGDLFKVTLIFPGVE